MKKIAITGGIGSGKSLICKVFNKLGIPIYNADERAKNLYDSDAELKQQMIALFGSNLYKSGCLDRKLLASIIFTNTDLLQKVTGWIHPAVARDFTAWTKVQQAPYVIHEAAIIFESNLQHMVDEVINVSATEEIRIKRVSLRDKLSSDEIKRRIALQLSDNERNSMSQFIIYNNGNEALLPQILKIHYQLID